MLCWRQRPPLCEASEDEAVMNWLLTAPTDVRVPLLPTNAAPPSKSTVRFGSQQLDHEMDSECTRCADSKCFFASNPQTLAPCSRYKRRICGASARALGCDMSKQHLPIDCTWACPYAHCKLEYDEWGTAIHKLSQPFCNRWTVGPAEGRMVAVTLRYMIHGFQTAAPDAELRLPPATNLELVWERVLAELAEDVFDDKPTHASLWVDDMLLSLTDTIDDCDGKVIEVRCTSAIRVSAQRSIGHIRSISNSAEGNFMGGQGACVLVVTISGDPHSSRVVGLRCTLGRVWDGLRRELRLSSKVMLLLVRLTLPHTQEVWDDLHPCYRFCQLGVTHGDEVVLEVKRLPRL